MKTRVVHCKREKYDVYIGRPSKWGNPFEIGKDGTREEVVQKYQEWVLSQPDLMAYLGELQGKTLACWCSPQACHGDVLAELADTDNNDDTMHLQMLPMHQDRKCTEAETQEEEEDPIFDLHDYPIRICVAGSRSFHDPERFNEILRLFLSWAGKEPYALISGAAWRGPDRLVIDWAKENNVPCFEFLADWEGLGKKAGHIRNGVMRKNLTHLLAIWDGESRGTLEMIEATRKMEGIHVSVVTVKPDSEWIEMQKKKAAENPHFSKNRFRAKHYVRK